MDRRLVAVGVALAVGVVLLLHVVGGPGHSEAPVAPLRTAARATAPSRAELVVDVAGAVTRPGLYHLAPGTRVADAVALAGGATRKADVDLVNLAAPLADGEQVVVPVRGAAGAGGGPSATAPVDLNTATTEQLDALPGIGPTTAQKIVDYRQANGPFRTVGDLEQVPGIGPSKVAQLKGLVIP